MTELTFWEDESPLIQLIAGEEWAELKRICPKRVRNGHYILATPTPKAIELFETAYKKIGEAYERIIEKHFHGVADHKIQERLFEVVYEHETKKLVIEMQAFLPNFGPHKILFPQLNFFMLHGEEFTKGENKKKLTALETTLIGGFKEQGYVFQSQTSLIATHHFSETSISTLEGLDKLFSDLKTVYDNLKGAQK